MPFLRRNAHFYEFETLLCIAPSLIPAKFSAYGGKPHRGNRGEWADMHGAMKPDLISQATMSLFVHVSCLVSIGLVAKYIQCIKERIYIITITANGCYMESPLASNVNRTFPVGLFVNQIL